VERTVGFLRDLEKIALQSELSIPIPAAFGIYRYYFQYERQHILWRALSHGDIGIMTILHEQMHQLKSSGEFARD